MKIEQKIELLKASELAKKSTWGCENCKILAKGIDDLVEESINSILMFTESARKLTDYEPGSKELDRILEDLKNSRRILIEGWWSRNG
jgi:hypothetical protein